MMYILIFNKTFFTFRKIWYWWCNRRC